LVPKNKGWTRHPNFIRLVSLV